MPVEPAMFQYGSLNVLPEEGTGVTISVAVENIGGETGAESVELEINGSVAPVPDQFPIVYVAVGLVVIAAAAYFYMQSQKQE